MSLIVTERGSEYRRRETYSLDELLYWIFADQTFWQAVDYELEHRHRKNDVRMIIFPKQIELLEKLSPKWAKRCEREQQEILRENPFNDVPPELR